MTSNRRQQRSAWPPALAQLGAIRFARRYYRFQEAVAFYRDLVGFVLCETFRDSYGSTGAIFALPDTTVTFEILQSPAPVESAAQEPICLYFRDEGAMAAARDRLVRAGVAMAPAHPYWRATGAVCFLDPEGREVVLAPFVYGENEPDAGSASGKHEAFDA